MQKFYLTRIREIKENLDSLRKKLGLKISILGRTVTVEGDPLDEYESSLIFDAVNFGFPLSTAMLLTNPEYSFREIPIKDFTRKKNLEPVRARLIGKQGRTRKTIEEISGCKVKIKGNAVGIIGLSEEMEYAITAIKNLIKGSKQANVYNYLERINRRKK